MAENGEDPKDSVCGWKEAERKGRLVRKKAEWGWGATRDLMGGAGSLHLHRPQRVA